MRTFASALLVGTATFAVALAPGAATAAPAEPSQVRNMASAECLDGASGPARVAQCDNSALQAWTYLDGQLRTGEDNERCLTNEDDGMATVTFCRSGDPKQFWRHSDNGELINDVSDTCLTQRPDDHYTFLDLCVLGAPEQRWDFTPVS